MKTLSSFLILACLAGAIMLAISIPGCLNPIADSGRNPFQARSEREFVANRNLRAIPGMVVAVNLEHFNSPEDTIPDTETIGIDRIAMRYEENGIHNLTLAPDAYFSLRLEDQEGVTIFQLAPDNRAISINIPAGDYFLFITSYINWHSDSLVGRQTVFIQPNATGEGPDGHYGPKQLNTIYRSGSCPNCDLRNSNMINLYLTGAILNGADFQQSNLRNTNFSHANLSYANLRYCDLSFTNMYYATATGAFFKSSNMYGSDIEHTTLYGADLSYVNLNNAYLNFSNLQTANLSYANLLGADIRGTDFCGADKTGINGTGVLVSEATQCWP